jgi:hypothetical protein
MVGDVALFTSPVYIFVHAGGARIPVLDRRFFIVMIFVRFLIPRRRPRAWDAAVRRELTASDGVLVRPAPPGDTLPRVAATAVSN